MGLPKSFRQLKSGSAGELAQGIITWDGTITEGIIEVPAGSKSFLLSVDNSETGKTLTATLEHHVRIDDSKASAQIGEGDNGVVTVTRDEPGPDGEEYSVKVVVPELEEATDVEVELDGKVIAVELALKEEGEDYVPDDDKNTATLIAGAIDALEGFSAQASGNGTGVFDDEVEAVQFTGGTTDIWITACEDDGSDIEFDIGSEGSHVFGPVDGFPFIKGRVKITAGEAPDNDDYTVVQVQEI